MEADEVLKLYDSCWFTHQIFKKQPSLPVSQANTDLNNLSTPSKPKISPRKALRIRPVRNDTNCSRSLKAGSVSPNSVLQPLKLQRDLSRREIEHPRSEPERNQVPVKRVLCRRRSKGADTKSLSELEFEELKGFMDLGFIFTENDKDSELASIIPGLQRLGKKTEEDEGDECVQESAISRPYLSEAWEFWERKRRENPLMVWEVPRFGCEPDMKSHIRQWAHTVASAVR